MSEIYRNSTQFVYLDIHGSVADATPTAVCNGTPLEVTGPQTIDSGAQRWTATIGLVQTQNVGELKVTWDFTLDGLTAQKVDYFDVVVPLVELGDLLVEFADAGVAEADLLRVEKKVRNYIENYTNQKFSPSLETITVKATGTNLILPKRLISVTETNPTFLGGYTIDNDGWGMTLTVPYDYDYPGVIVAPYSNPNVFYRNVQNVAITGRWGYDRVPQAVQEAAELLIEDFIAPESVYRDKYLASLTSPDWRIQFNSKAFTGTGNARVDQLLSGFVNTNRWLVI